MHDEHHAGRRRCRRTGTLGAVAAMLLALSPAAAAFELGDLRSDMDYWAAKAALERQTDRFLDFGPDYMTARSESAEEGEVTFRTVFCDGRLRAANMAIEGRTPVLFGLLRTLADRHGAPGALRTVDGPDGLYFEWPQSEVPGHLVSAAIAVDPETPGRSVMEVSGSDPSACGPGRPPAAVEGRDPDADNQGQAGGAGSAP